MERWIRARYLPGLPMGKDGRRVTAGKEHIALSRRAAREGMVLLKNEENALPLAAGTKVALFGKATIDYVKGGGGSGDVTVPYIRNLYDGFAEVIGKDAVYPGTIQFYRDYVAAQSAAHWAPGMVAEPTVPAELLREARAFTETAVVSFSRFSGEGWDRKHPKAKITRKEPVTDDAVSMSDALFERGDFYLSDAERAMLETGIHNLNPEIVKMLGRMRYRTSYGQNVLNHSIEVSHIAGLLASELGVDVTTAKRAGLLHDIGKSIDHEVEGSHVTIGVDILRKYKENEEVIHAVEAHHGDVEPHTVIACLVQAADAISASRPGARRENIENYVKRLEKLEEISRSFPGISSSYAIQAGREIRIMVKPEEVSEDQMVLLARDIAKKIEAEMTYPGQIKVHVLRETKAVDYAK